MRGMDYPFTQSEPLPDRPDSEGAHADAVASAAPSAMGGKGTPPSNTVPSNCNFDVFKPLRWGVDSLYLSYPGQIQSYRDSLLQRLKEKAQSPIPSEQATAQFAWKDHIFEVKDKGAPLFPYILEDNAFRIQVSRSSGRVPLAYVKVSSDYLANASPKSADDALKPLIRYLGHYDDAEPEANVSRIDLFVDFVSPIDMESWDRHTWVTRARSIHTHSVDGHFSGWSIGLGGVISARLYDKTLEIQKSGKTYLHDIWTQSGWDGISKVWRLEFQLRRDVLVELGLVGLDKVLANLNGLWSYATTDWLRLTLPQDDDKTRSRWPIHPLWGYLSSVDWETPGGPLSARFSNERIPSVEKIYGRYLSVLTSFMALAGSQNIEEASNDLYEHMTKHFLKISDIIGVDYLDFVLGKVAIKARQYNTILNAVQDEVINEVEAKAIRDYADEYRRLSDGE